MSTISDGGPYVEVPITSRGTAAGHALVSQVDGARVLAFKWRLATNGYVMRCGSNAGSVLLHRFIVGAPAGCDVHHRNGRKTDCRRENLTALSPKEHQEHHKHIVVARNLKSRVHALQANCKSCGVIFMKHPDHRGRQSCCSKRCAITLAVAARKQYAMLAARSKTAGGEA